MTMTASVADLLNEVLAEELAPVDPEVRERLVDSIGELLDRAIADERARCATIARLRAELWRRTPLSSSASAAAREEARARANEGIVIADMIDSAASAAAAKDEDEEAN